MTEDQLDELFDQQFEEQAAGKFEEDPPLFPAHILARSSPLQRMPKELKMLDRWCLAGPIDSNFHKAPCLFVNGNLEPISVVTDLHRLMTFEDLTETLAINPELNGGFVLVAGDNLTCIDLDLHDDDGYQRGEQMMAMVNAMQSYTELSQSGAGYHIWLKGEVAKTIKRHDIEVYSKERFIICTGHALDNLGADMFHHDQEALDYLNSLAVATDYSMNDQPATMGDMEVATLAMEHDQSGKFRALSAGDWEAFLTIRVEQERGTGIWDASEADSAFMGIITHYTKNFAQCERLWKMTPLADMHKRYRLLSPVEREKKVRAQTKRFGRPDKIMRTIAHAMNKNLKDEAEAEALRVSAVEDGKRLAASMQASLAAAVAEAEATKATSDNPGSIPFPPGFAGALAQHFLKTSGRPIPEFAIASSLALLAGVAGMAYNCQQLRSGINNYFIVLAESGIGKSWIIDQPENFLAQMRTTYNCVNAHLFLNRTGFTHENSMLMALQEQPCFVWANDEFGQDFIQMSGEKAGSKATIPGLLTTLFGRSGYGKTAKGVAYTDKAKRVELEHPVALSVLAESVPSIVFDNINVDMFENGFMSRTLFLHYQGQKPEMVDVIDESIPEPIANHFATLLERAAQHVANPTGIPTFVGMDAHVTKAFRAFDNHCTQEFNRIPKHKVWEKAMNTRYAEKAIRLATLLAVADNPASPCVNKDHWEWAIKFVGLNNDMILGAVEKGNISQGGNTEATAKLRDYLRMYITDGIRPSRTAPEYVGLFNRAKANNIVLYTHVAERLMAVKPFNVSKDRALLKHTITQLVEEGVLVPVLKNEMNNLVGTQGAGYRIVMEP